jgi:hypothetical protein
LTRAEFAAEVRAGERDFKLLGSDERYASGLARCLATAEADGNNLDVAREAFDKAIGFHHEADVLIAYADGLPVPNCVLREYAERFTDDARRVILEAPAL